MKIVKIEKKNVTMKRYDIEVAWTHSYFADNILVHNCKMDGARCHIHFDGQQCKLFSRSGKTFQIHGVFDKDAQRAMKSGETFDGEIVFIDKHTGKYLDRKTSNGLASKAIKGTLSKDEAGCAVLVVWDIVDFSSTIPYKTRFEELCHRLHMPGKDSNIRLINWVIVNNAADAETFYLKQLENGEEGAVLKNINSVWQPKRTKDLGKMKSELDCTLKIIGIEEGTGKNVGKLGAFVCSTDSGNLVVNVGTGFSDKEREEYFDSNMLGTYIDVLYNQVICKKGDFSKSLFLPRFLKIRFDKDVTDSF